MGQTLSLVDPYSDPSRAPGQRVSFQFWRQPVYELQDGTYWHPGAYGPTYLTNVDTPWSYLYLGLPITNPYTPGKITVRPREFRDADKKKAAGNDGARVTIHGRDLVAVDMELLIWTPEQLRQFALLWPMLFPPSHKGSPPAVDVQHPALSRGMRSVKSIQFLSAEGPDIDAQGRGVFRLTAIEFSPPSNKNVTKTEVQSLGSILDVGAKDVESGAHATPGKNPANLGPR